MVLKIFFKASSKLFIYTLDRVIIPKNEAVVLLCLYHLQQIAIFISPYQNWPESDANDRFQAVQCVSKLFNFRFIMEWITIPVDSISWISAFTLFCILHFIGFIKLLFANSSETDEFKSSNMKTIYASFELITKYSTYVLTIPILQTCVLNLAGTYSNIALGAFSLVLFCLYSLPEKLFFEESSFIEANYLCKTFSNQKIYDSLAMIMVIATESFPNNNVSRLTVSVLMMVFFAYKLQSTLSWDYFYINDIQRIHTTFIGVEFSLWIFLFISSILRISNAGSIPNAPFVIALLIGFKLTLNVQQRTQFKLINKFDKITSAGQAERYINLLINLSNLYKKFETDNFISSDEEVNSTIEPIYHFGLVANDYYHNYGNLESIWMSRRLYDPLMFRTYEADALHDEELILKNAPRSVNLYKHYIKDLFIYFLKRFPKSASLHLSFASFMLHYLRHTHLVILECFQLKKLFQDTRINFKLETSRLRILNTVNKLQQSLDFVRKEDSNYMNLDILEISNFEKRYISFASKINIFLKTDFEFLELLSQEHVHLDNVYRKGQALTNLLEDIRKDFKLHLFGSPLATQIFVEFQSMVLMDDIEARELAKQLEIQVSKIENYARREKDFYEIELMFNKNASIIQIGAHLENLGKINYVNEGSVKLFGYQAKELELANVNVLMPRLLRFFHDSFLRNYFETGRETILYREQRSFGRNRDGNIFPLSLLVKPTVNLETSQFMFIAYLKELQTSSEYIIADQNGCIDGISKKLAETLGITSEMLDSNLVQTQLLCPKLALLFNLKPDESKLHFGFSSIKKTLLNSRGNLDDNKSRADFPDSAELRRYIESRKEFGFEFLLRNDPQEYCLRLGELLPKNVIEFNESLITQKKSGTSSKLEIEFVKQLTKALNVKKTDCLEQMVEVTGFISEYASSSGTLKWYIFRFVGLENLNIYHTNRISSKKVPALKTLKTHKITKFVNINISKSSASPPESTGHVDLSNKASQENGETAIIEERGNRLEEFFKELKQTENEGDLKNGPIHDPEDISDDLDSENDHTNCREENFNTMRLSTNPKMMSSLVVEYKDTRKRNGIGYSTNSFHKRIINRRRITVSFDEVHHKQTQNEAPKKGRVAFGTTDHKDHRFQTENFVAAHDSELKDSSHLDHLPNQITQLSADHHGTEEEQGEKITVSFQGGSSQASAKSEIKKDILGMFRDGGLALDHMKGIPQVKKIQASISSTGSSSKYEFRAIRSAIRFQYIPGIYHQAKWMVISMFILFWVSFLVISVNQVISFANLDQIPITLNVANQVAYKIHKLGTIGYDLSLVGQFSPQNQSSQILNSNLTSILDEDRTNLRNDVLEFLNNHSVYEDYYNDVDSILTQVVPVDFANLTVPISEYFYKFLLQANQLFENCQESLQANSSSGINDEYANNLISAYQNLSTPISNWAAFFTNIASLKYSDTSKNLAEVFVISISILVFAVISIYKSIKAAGIIDDTVYQITYLSNEELMSMKEQLIRAKSLFNGLNAGQELINFAHSQEKSQRAGFKFRKKRIHRISVSPIKRAIPTLLLAIGCIGLQIFISTVNDVFFSQLTDNFLNALFFASEDVSTQQYIAIYKNYSINTIGNSSANFSSQGLIQYFTDELDQISPSYQKTLLTVEATFSSSSQNTIHNIMFVNTCKYTTYTTFCPQLLYGIFEEGLLTAKLGTIDYMIKQMEVQLNATQRWQTFQIVLDSGTIIHEMLSIMMNLTLDQTRNTLNFVQIFFMVLAIAVPILSLLLFRWYWKKCISQLKAEFVNARRILEIIPIPYIIGNSRLKSFVAATGSVVLKK